MNLRKGTTDKLFMSLLVGPRLFPLILSSELLLAETPVVWVNIRSKEMLKSDRSSTCAGHCWSRGAVAPSEGPWASHAPRGETLPCLLGHTPEPRSLRQCTRGGKEQGTGRVRLPGVMGTAGGFGWHRVAA